MAHLCAINSFNWIDEPLSNEMQERTKLTGTKTCYSTWQIKVLQMSKPPPLWNQPYKPIKRVSNMKSYCKKLFPLRNGSQVNDDRM